MSIPAFTSKMALVIDDILNNKEKYRYDTNGVRVGLMFKGGYQAAGNIAKSNVDGVYVLSLVVEGPDPSNPRQKAQIPLKEFIDPNELLSVQAPEAPSSIIIPNLTSLR